MSRTPRRAAAWAAPLAPLVATVSPFKRTHKLKPMVCVLWLPDYGGYLRAVNLAAATFTVSASPDNALRLIEDQAEAVGQDLVDITGVRVHLRPFKSVH